VVPVAAAARQRWRIGSWDRLVTPLPLTRLVYVVGRPLSVPANARPMEIEEYRVAMERELNRITIVAEAAIAR